MRDEGQTMGRELKRVALDFDWPLKTRWLGYVNPWFDGYEVSEQDCPNLATHKAHRDANGWSVPDIDCAECNDWEVWTSKTAMQYAKAWQKTEPPTGDGFQLWETTSEGSPASPVFTTLEELCDWCETNATTFADYRASAAEWRSMLERDFVHATDGNMTFI